MHALRWWTPLALAACAGPGTMLPRADGYRGIWYANQPSGDEYRFKYSGGFATYPQQHVPIAVYRPEVDKTFFVYGGVENDSLHHMVAYFDHSTGTVPRPTVLLDKLTRDAHDNPTLTIDPEGYLWVFSNAHGTARPSYVHRSTQPYSIDAFELVVTTNFSYAQPWHLGAAGFCVLHTKYAGGRRLFVWTSPDGTSWDEPTPLAFMGQGHYQVSWRDSDKLATAFNYHPLEVGLNARTNLYYLETADGKTWRDVRGDVASLPLSDTKVSALVHDYEAEGRLVYLKDLQFDAAGNPVILFLTSGGYEAGPSNDPRIWHTARWNGVEWVTREVVRSDHNYDFGSLYIEPDGAWRLIAPTDPGPQPWGTGGEMVMWRSADQGERWERVAELTSNSPRNHTYARRPVDAHPGFYALWADGDALEESESHLYFATRDGEVYRLPTTMDADRATPERL